MATPKNAKQEEVKLIQNKSVTEDEEDYIYLDEL